MRRRLAIVLLLAAGCRAPVPAPQHRHPIDPVCPAGAPALDVPFFHGDRARLGWNAAEPDLTPEALRAGGFGWVWDSPQLDSVTILGRRYAPHLYASPLYVDHLTLHGGEWDGVSVSAIIAATSNGWIYAISACGQDVGARHLAAGTILWRAQIAEADVVPGLDGGVPMGILSTPAIDTSATPPRVYAAAMDRTAGWQVAALDLSSGQLLDGWPLVLTDANVNAVNANGPSRFQAPRIVSQRGALNLSRGGDLLYVPFGAYGDKGSGWMIAVDTRQRSVVAAFSSARNVDVDTAYGGIWGAGGAAIADDDRIFVTSGNTPPASGPTPNVWGESLLAWTPPLTLAGTYTPWNYCQLDAIDADLTGSSPLIVPDLDPSQTATPHLVAFGSKQGNVYLVDRDHLPGSLTSRPPCSQTPATESSLLPPMPQPQFGARGPLNVFGPYSEQLANLDHAKMRSTPAFFRSSDGVRYLFVSGATKASANSTRSVSPSLVRLRLQLSPGQPAYLEVDGRDQALAFVNPGSPVVSSQGSAGAVVWVLDQNAQRVASLLDPSTPHPVLYAVDATTMELLWRSPDNDLYQGGKYSTPLVAHGFVFVGTDRIEAYGFRR